MNVPEAKIICDSISPEGDRLTTMEVKMHRFVLAEFNTHRVFSRNSASSRAIPVAKMLERVKNDPAMPVWWGKNQAGMSAREKLFEYEKNEAIKTWLELRDKAVESVEYLQRLDVHKQIANRLLEPWLWHYAIVSSTEWDNFFAQRCHPDAQPEMHAAAMAMQLAYYMSIPIEVDYGQWHLPYITLEDWNQIYHDYVGEEMLDRAKKISVARCARVSYLTHDGKRDLSEDIKMYDKLINANPMHSSPFEHVATPMTDPEWYGGAQRGNFCGWNQLRHTFPNESITKFLPNHPDLIK